MVEAVELVVESVFDVVVEIEVEGLFDNLVRNIFFFVVAWTQTREVAAELDSQVDAGQQVGVVVDTRVVAVRPRGIWRAWCRC